MKCRLTLALLLGGLMLARPAMSAVSEQAVLAQMQQLNAIPEDQMDEKMDPALSILRKLIDMDGPEFLTVRRLAGKAEVRGPMTPATRAVIAGIVSPRWDAYSLAGNLWLSALKTPNDGLREKARRKMIQFVQPSHVPELINQLKSPPAKAPAYEILREISGQNLPPDPAAWAKWWNANRASLDVVGNLIATSRAQLADHPITPFTHERLWYPPDGVRDRPMAYEKRTPEEQVLLQRWNAWALGEARRYAVSWADAKPLLERITHHPDPRVNKFLEALLKDEAYGDYAALVLAWRQSRDSLPALVKSNADFPTVARSLARGSLGDKQALLDLLAIIDRSGSRPLSYGYMEDDLRSLLPSIKGVGVLPAEEALELLCHKGFGFAAAETGKEKRKRFEKARDWLQKNIDKMAFDPRRGYFALEKK